GLAQQPLCHVLLQLHFSASSLDSNSTGLKTEWPSTAGGSRYDSEPRQKRCRLKAASSTTRQVPTISRNMAGAHFFPATNAMLATMNEAKSAPRRKEDCSKY